MTHSDGLGAIHRYEIATFGGLIAVVAVVAAVEVVVNDGVLLMLGAVALGTVCGTLAYQGFRANIARQFDGRLMELRHPVIEHRVTSIIRTAVATSPVAAFFLGLVVYSGLGFVVTVVLVILAVSMLCAQRKLSEVERRQHRWLLQRPLFRRHGFAGGPYALVRAGEATQAEGLSRERDQ